MGRDHSDVVTGDIRLLTSARIPTRHGEYQLALYANAYDEKDHLALVHGDVKTTEDVLVRIHSECFTGDVLGSLRCDCGEQLDASMRMIAEEGAGIILYLRQEGRGIGLHDKLRAYNLQDEGYDTVDANLALGHGADERDYTIGALMLHDLGIRSVRLLTNNPEKIDSLEAHDINVVDRVPVQPRPNKHNADYLQTKLERMQHMLELERPQGAAESSRSALIDSLRRRIERHGRSELTNHPFVSIVLRQRLDGTMTEPQVDQVPSFIGPVAAQHDAMVTGPHHLDELTGTLGPSAPSAAPLKRLVVVDFELEATIESYRKAASRFQLAVATINVDANKKHLALEKLGVDIIHTDKPDFPDSLIEPIMDWLSHQDVHSACIHGRSSITRLFLSHRIPSHIVLQLYMSYIDSHSSDSVRLVPFSIRKSEHIDVGKTPMIVGRIIYQ